MIDYYSNHRLPSYKGAILFTFIAVFILMVMHEFGHFITMILYGTPFDPIFLEEGFMNGDESVGLVVGFMRYKECDLLGELIIRFIGPFFFQVLALVGFYKFTPQYTHLIHKVIWIFACIILLVGDFLIFINWIGGQ